MKAKPKLRINVKEEGVQDISNGKDELVESIYKEIEDYSLTPTNIKGRELQLFKNIQKLTVEEPKYDLQEVIDSLTSQLSIATHIQNKQQQELLTSNITIKPESSKKLYNNAKEKSYINDYNMIASEIDLSNFPYFFIDQYEGIVRYGINVHDKTTKIVESFNEFIKYKTNEYNKQLEDVGKGGSEKGGSDKGSQKSANKLAFDENSLKILHSLETLVLTNAINHAVLNKQKVMLVDIFERNKDGSIGTEESQGSIMIGNVTLKPKTHTIVLCRKEAVTNEDEYNFLVIDPSNSEFSKHLGMTGVNYVINNLEIGKSVKIEVSSTPYKIYEQKKEIGTGCAFDKFRDCIDIAFKLAIKFNTLAAENINFDTKEKTIFVNPLANKIVEHITNNYDYDSKIDRTLCTQKFLDYPFRGKQLTDHDKGENFYNKQLLIYKVIRDMVNDISVYDTKVGEFIQQKMFSCLNNKNFEEIRDFGLKLQETQKIYKEAQTKAVSLWEMGQLNDHMSTFDLLLGDLKEINEGFADYYS